MSNHSLDDSSCRAHQPLPAQPGRSLFSTAANASTIASDDISSTNGDTEETGMSRMGGAAVTHCGGSQAWCGNAPVTLRPLYTRYVEMRHVKSMPPEPRKAKIAILRWSSPVVVG